MFKQLISNLPYNPSLINQVGFYASRLRQEKAIRRLSFVFMALAMAVQSLAVISPPEKSLAYDNSNHIINGIRTKQDIINAWNNDPTVSQIYGKFGVTYQDILNLTETPNQVITSNDGDWWSIGRNSLTGYTNISDVYKNSQIPIEYAPGSYVYMRNLRAWDVNVSYTRYPAFEGWSDTAGHFWILEDCGNFTREGPPPAAKPQVDVRKTIEGYSSTPTLKPGDSYNYRIEYKNTVPESIAHDVYIEDRLDINNFDVVRTNPALSIDSGGFFRHFVGNLSYKPTYDVIEITVRIKSSINTNKNVCNSVKITSTDGSSANGGPVCVHVVPMCPIVNKTNLLLSDPNCFEPCPLMPSLNKNDPRCTPCPYNGAILAENPNCDAPPEYCPIAGRTSYLKNDPRCVPVCPLDTSLDQTDPKCVVCPYYSNILTGDSKCKPPLVSCEITDTAINLTLRKATFKTKIKTTDPSITKATSYLYDFGDQKTQTVETQSLENIVDHTYEPGKFTAKVKIYYVVNSTSGNTEYTTECSSPISFEADKPLGQIKTVRNETQKIDGDSVLIKKLQPNDVLSYSLFTINSQNYDRLNIKIEDNINDLLDYADLDLASLEESGGKFDKNSGKVYWENVTIPASSDIEMKFIVKLKDQIPATNKPSNVTTSFDCKISNEYGNEISLKVSCPAVKGIETLPNTGPGSSLIVGGCVTAVIGYFFARARLLSKEMQIIRTDYSMSGGA